jgi:hypothetical protein
MGKSFHDTAAETVVDEIPISMSFVPNPLYGSVLGRKVNAIAEFRDVL